MTAPERVGPKSGERGVRRSRCTPTPRRTPSRSLHLGHPPGHPRCRPEVPGMRLIHGAQGGHRAGSIRGGHGAQDVRRRLHGLHISLGEPAAPAGSRPSPEGAGLLPDPILTHPSPHARHPSFIYKPLSITPSQPPAPLLQTPAPLFVREDTPRPLIASAPALLSLPQGAGSEPRDRVPPTAGQLSGSRSAALASPPALGKGSGTFHSGEPLSSRPPPGGAQESLPGRRGLGPIWQRAKRAPSSL